MNHIYRSIWNSKTGTFTAVSENTKTGGKQASAGTSVMTGAGFALKALAASLLMVFGSSSYALPVGGEVVAGNATVSSGNGSMTVNQTSQNVVLNWQSFNIGAAEAVRFVQPNSSSVALNRVIGADPSSILGSLSANGKVFLVNPNGILFGKGASVNVGGLVASTRNISDSDFMAGNYKFASTGGGSILNQGSINADGGYVALLGAHVSNEGIINARLGTVALAAGNGITLDVVGDGLLNVTVNEGAVHALVQNGGMIQADGGQVLMTAQAAGNLLQTVVNNTGVIQAQTIENHNGVIKLLGDMQSGTVNVGGKLDASAPDGGNGGFIETSAAHVQVQDSARISTAAAQGLTGSWLIDPTDYTIAASGGDITGAALSSNLASTNVTILSTSGGSGSSGDVNVNDTVTWSANKLTLNAQNNININTAMNASGTASLALEYGQAAVAAGNTSTVNVNAPINLPAGNNFSTKLGSDGSVKAYTVITSLGAAGSITATDLQGISGNLAGNYVLGANIDASATSGWNSGAGFDPVGNATAFTGIFDGLGHTISDLTINRPITDKVGLFGHVGTGGSVQNIGLVGGSITGKSMVGGLIGENAYGTVSNSYATGAVTGSSYTGGLVGNNYGGTISNSYATGAVNGGGYTGGLVGNNNYGGGTISNSYASGAVSGSNNVGGLAGRSNGTVSNSYATGAVNGSGVGVGGLIGYNSYKISNSYASGAVSGSSKVGGLAGRSESGTVSNSYASGAVNGSGIEVGGLIGYNASTISNSYAIGAVSGTGSRVGGLAGFNNGTVTASFWNTTTSGQAISDGGVGMTTADMQTQANFTSVTAANGNKNPAWDMANTWVMYDDHTSPLLRSFMTALTVTANNATKTYDGLAYSGGNGVSYSTTPNGNLLGTLGYGGTSQSATNAGTYAITGSGLYSNQQGYIINYVDGALTVNKAKLTLSGTRVYDGTKIIESSVLTATGVAGETFTLTGSGALASKNVQAGSALQFGPGLKLGTSSNGGLSSNYTLSRTGNSVSITKADLTLATSDVSKTYDGGLSAAGTATVTSGSLFGSDAISGGTFAFTDKNVGSGNKTVTTTGVTVADGNSGGNYNVSYADNTTSTIVPKALTVAGETALDKVYDGTTLATLTGGTLVGLISGDTVTLIEAGTFATPNAGNGIAVAAAVSLSGSSAGNYTVTQPTGLTANITAPVSTAPVSVVDSDPRHQDAIASVATLMSATSLQGNMANAQLSLTQGGGESSADSSSSTTSDASPSIQHSISSIPGGLTGLNLSITGNGVKLPSGARASDARDDKN